MPGSANGRTHFASLLNARLACPRHRAPFAQTRPLNGNSCRMLRRHFDGGHQRRKSIATNIRFQADLGNEVATNGFQRTRPSLVLNQSLASLKIFWTDRVIDASSVHGNQIFEKKNGARRRI